jgi:hypothetical protein
VDKVDEKLKEDNLVPKISDLIEYYTSVSTPQYYP